MEYLPSKKFLKRATIGLLLIGGWFYFSSTGGAKVTKNSDGTLENSGGIIVFSRNKSSTSPELNKAEDWPISEEASSTSAFVNPGIMQDNAAIVSNGTKTESFNPYETSDITISEVAGNKTSYQKYAGDLVKALKPYSIESLPNEGYLTLQSIENNTPEEFKKVEVMSQLHKVVADTLLSMQVPKELATSHLALINNSAKLSYLDSIMAKALEKPDEVMDAVNGFKTETDALIKSITKIDNFFKDKGITFSQDQKIKIYVNNIQ